MTPDDCPEWAPDSDLDETTEDYPGDDLGLDPADSGNYDALDGSASDPETGTRYGDLT
jgi:hypothetical protein